MSEGWASRIGLDLLEFRSKHGPGGHRAVTRFVIWQASTDVILPISSGLMLAAASLWPSAGFVAWIALVPFAAAIARPHGTLELYAGAFLGGALYALQSLDFMRTRLTGAGLLGSHFVDWIVAGFLWGALFWPCTLLVARRVWRRSRLSMWVLLPIVWVGSEWLRQESGWIVNWSPFPWLQIGATQIEYSHLIQIADLGGVWGIGALVATVNGALFDCFASRWSLRPVAIVGVILLGVWSYGEFRLEQTATSEGPVIGLVPKSIQPVAALGTNPSVDMLVWSETALLRNLDNSRSDARDAIDACARSVGSTLVVGCVREEAGQRFNSAAFVDSHGIQGFYDKCYLVPWSEFAPWTWQRDLTSRSAFSPGTRRPVFDIGSFRCGISICYDAAFDRHSRAFTPMPDFFVACSCETSDATGAVARLMLTMTRLRAIETRRSFVRNVEGGLSGIVDSTGAFVAVPDQAWPGPVVVGRVPIDSRATFASVAGDWIPICCVTCVALMLIFCIRPRQLRNLFPKAINENLTRAESSGEATGKREPLRPGGGKAGILTV